MKGVFDRNVLFTNTDATACSDFENFVKEFSEKTQYILYRKRFKGDINE